MTIGRWQAGMKKAFFSHAGICSIWGMNRNGMEWNEMT